MGKIAVVSARIGPAVRLVTPAPSAGAAIPYAASGPWTANGLGVLTVPSDPSAAGNILILTFGAGGNGAVTTLSTSVSGGGVDTWQRAAGYLDTSGRWLTEIWWGIITAPVTTGSSTVVVANSTAGGDFGRLWLQEFAASGSPVTWRLAADSPGTGASGAGPTGTGPAVSYPALTGTGLYAGAATCRFGSLLAGTTPGFTWAEVDSHLQATWDAVAASAAPASASTDGGELWVTTGALLAATSFPVPLAIFPVTPGGGTTTWPYSAALAATGGTPRYTWAVTSGSLPPGLSLSASTGVISGTPTAAGASSFTVQVTDQLGGTASQTFSITVATVASTIYSASYPATFPKYTAPSPDSQLSLAGNPNLPFADSNVWGPVAGETLTLNVWSVRNWEVQVTAQNSFGTVTCFPNTGAYPLSIAWNSYSYLISGWDEIMDDAPGMIASACYDNFFANTLVGPTGKAINEVMFHFDFRNRGAGPWVATAVPFGGYTVNGIYIPLTHWNLSAPVGGTAVYWNLVDGNGFITSLTSGAVDALAMFRWLVTAGYLDGACNMTAFSAGYEVCDTENVQRNFVYKNLWWYGA